MSVDADLIEAGREAVDQGRVETMSAWVNEALGLKADHDRRMLALDRFIATYEAEHGEITEEEMDQAVRRVRARATVVRGEPADVRPRGGRQRGGA